MGEKKIFFNLFVILILFVVSGEFRFLEFLEFLEEEFRFWEFREFRESLGFWSFWSFWRSLGFGNLGSFGRSLGFRFFTETRFFSRNYFGKPKEFRVTSLPSSGSNQLPPLTLWQPRPPPLPPNNSGGSGSGSGGPP